MNSKRGQLTIFIIIAIIIVASVVAFLIFRDRLFGVQIPPSIQPAYNSFLSCLEDNTLTGIDLLESQAGYVYFPDFEPGSRYMPFSSQLIFLGNPVPYWYYISGNNIQKEQIPSKADMERQLEDFVVSEIRGCVLDSYYEEGFEIDQEEPTAKVFIRDNNVEVNLYEDLSIVKGEDSVLIRNHKIVVNSRLGNLYDSARNVYEKEQKDLFLENYTVDILRLYAPVDGVELTCGPRVWSADEVFDNLQEAVETNILALRTTGDREDYFYVDVPVSGDEDVRFINSQDWPNNFEVSPSEENILIANPVGNQPGLGILGFCYVPYHFVYNVKYPVLIQIYDSATSETFQFPMAVVVQGNKPREALTGSAVEIASPELCTYKNTPVTVRTYDTSLNPVEADISYECFGEICNIGETSSGILEGNFPQCVNGYVVVKADGFEDTKYLYSTVSGGSVDVILDRLYNININLRLDGGDYTGDAIINFISENGSKTVIYPGRRTVDLSEGQYEIEVDIYRNSNIRFESTTKEQCIEVSRTGLLGLLGMTETKCFEVEIPSQIISNVLSGGGREDYYILGSELRDSNTIEINAQSLPLPDSIEDLQNNYLLFEDKELGVVFK